MVEELAVLVVDDEVLVLELMREGLEEAGFRVLTALDADEACGIIDAEDRLSALVADINLGRGQRTGWEVARHARRRRDGIAVVFVSGDSAHDWSVHGVPDSVMIPKPFAPSHVAAVLAERLWRGDGPEPRR